MNGKTPWLDIRITVVTLVTVLSSIGSLQAFPRFKDITAQAGLDFTLTSGLPSKEYILESMSGGVGWIDFDSDGWMDIYLVNGSTLEGERKSNNPARNRLFRNNHDATFTDVTQQAGVGDTRWGMGACVADVNNDGWDDIYVTNFGANVLFLNNGDGTFRDFSRESGADDPSWSSSAAFADYDADGDVDLYVSNYLFFDVHNPPQDTDLCRYRGMKVQCGPRGLPAQGDRFFENRGDATFSDRTLKSGIRQPQASYGLGVVWGDYDNDGDMDIFVANDSTPNFLFQNNGDKTFTEVGLIAGVAVNSNGKEQAGMGVDFSDFDNDRDLDIIVTNFSNDTNTLYRNDANGFFAERTHAAGLRQVSWLKLGWGASFVDLDLDGWKDLAIVNGHVYPEVDVLDGRAEALASMEKLYKMLDVYELGPSYRQRNFIFRNLADGRFREATQEAGPGLAEVRNSRGLAVGDLNNDGHMDLLISNLDEAPSLLLNDGSASGNWTLLKLKGKRSNRSAIGARAYVRTGTLVQMREVQSGGSYQSQNDLRLHFGLGSHDVMDQILIRWPGGKEKDLTNVAANRILEIEEDD